MSHNYPRLDLKQFSELLFSHGDLDPIYLMLNEVQFKQVDLASFLVAYWCFYSAATSARIMECPDFYGGMYRANAENWPHGFERRHFRGESAVKAIGSLEKFGSPFEIVTYLTWPAQNAKTLESVPLTFDMVSSRVQSFYLFGPWIAWKVCDMLERVWGAPIDFTDTTLNIYKDPIQGAALLLKGSWKEPISSDEVEIVLEYLHIMLNEQGGYRSPPKYDRAINIQEFETVLCKYKAHVKGFYPPFNDTIEIAKGLREAAAGGSALAQTLLEALNQAKRVKPLPFDLTKEIHHE